MSLTNGNGHTAEKIADSVTMRLAARGSMLIAPFLLAGIGWFALEMLNDIKGSAADLANAVEEINDQLADSDRDIERLDGRINLGDRVNLEQDRRLDGHDARLNQFGRTVIPTP